MKKVVLAVSATLALSSYAAASPVMLYPVQTGAETARFLKGVPTLDLETDSGAVQITPLPFDHGHVVLGVAVYNKGKTPANFGIESVAASVADKPVPVLSERELEKRAKSRAMWSQIGVAMLAGAAAYAASTASTTNYYHGHMVTPHGVYAWSAAYRDNTIGVLGATAASAAGVAGIVGIQNRLDYTLANIADSTVQTTTVDPDASYGGRIVLEKIPGAKEPYDVRVMLKWNGAAYPFTFRVTHEGVNVPPPYAAPVAAAAPAPVQPAVVTSPAPAAPQAGPTT